MNDLTTKEFFRLLSEPSQVSNKEIQTSYESFVKQITETSNSEADYSKVFRLLNHSRIEIDSIKTSPLYELGGDVVKINYIRKALSFLHSEMELLKLKIQYPERFSLTEELSFKSELYVIPKAKGLGIIGLAELVMSIFLSKEIKNRNGKPASLVQLARAFEYVFNCNFGSIYDKQAEVYNQLVTTQVLF